MNPRMLSSMFGDQPGSPFIFSLTKKDLKSSLVFHSFFFLNGNENIGDVTVYCEKLEPMRLTLV